MSKFNYVLTEKDNFLVGISFSFNNQGWKNDGCKLFYTDKETPLPKKGCAIKFNFDASEWEYEELNFLNVILSKNNASIDSIYTFESFKKDYIDLFKNELSKANEAIFMYFDGEISEEEVKRNRGLRITLRSFIKKLNSIEKFSDFKALEVFMEFLDSKTE